MTLDEYYKTKGVDITDLGQKKDAPKKGEINAEWIKKEKLTLMNTKEDEKVKSRNAEFVNKREFSDKVGLGENVNAEILGFTSNKPKRGERREEEPKGERGQKHKKKGKEVVLKEEDFPPL